MRVIIEESYEGEIDSLSPAETAQKIEDAAHAAAYAVCKGHAFPEDGQVDALVELTEKLARAYEERMELMVRDITKAVAKDPDDTPLGKSHQQENAPEAAHGGWTMSTTADVLMRALGGADSP